MKRVLVTAIGGDIGQAIAQCLKSQYGDIYLFGTDVHDKHGGSLYVDEYITVPAANDSLYLDSLIKLVSENDIDVIIHLAALVGAPICNIDPLATKSINQDAIELLTGMLSTEQKIIMPD